MVRKSTQHAKCPSSWQDVGCPHVGHVLTGDRGVTLPHVSFSSLKGINHPIKLRQIYSIVCESSWNAHNITAHLRPLHPNVRLNKQKSVQLCFTLPMTKKFLRAPKRSQNLLTTHINVNFFLSAWFYWFKPKQLEINSTWSLVFRHKFHFAVKVTRCICTSHYQFNVSSLGLFNCSL